MGVVGSLPSPRPSSPEIKIENSLKESITPKDECDYCIMTMDDMDSNSNFSSNSYSNSTIDNQTESKNNKRTRQESRNVLNYGPINVKVRQSVAPTLATGRRSKFMQLEGDEAAKREIRRRRNREAAKKLKEKRITIEQKLQNDIDQLESKEQELLALINHLELYKQQLHVKYEHIVTIQERIARKAASTYEYIQSNHSQQVHYHTTTHSNNIHIKEEPDDESSSPSPSSSQWQLLFTI